MNQSFAAGLAVGLTAAAAALALTLWRAQARATARNHSSASPHEVTRWEGEGGNVPDVSVQAGQQAAAANGSAALPDAHRVATNREPIDVPHAASQRSR